MFGIGCVYMSVTLTHDIRLFELNFADLDYNSIDISTVLGKFHDCNSQL